MEGPRAWAGRGRRREGRGSGELGCWERWMVVMIPLGYVRQTSIAIGTEDGNEGNGVRNMRMGFASLGYICCRLV